MSFPPSDDKTIVLGEQYTLRKGFFRDALKESHGNVALERTKWISLMEEYAHFTNPDFVHSFFGKMTKEEIGYLVYKHADHHLLQFDS